MLKRNNKYIRYKIWNKKKKNISDLENCGSYRGFGYIYIYILVLYPCNTRLNQKSYVNSFFINLLKNR